MFLLRPSGEVKEVNPAARQLLDELDMPLDGNVAIKSLNLQQRLDNQEEIRHLEATLQNRDKLAELLIDGDYMTVDNELQAILIIRNITQQKASQRQIAYLAYHDSLTGLPNRRYFYEQLERSLLEAERLGQFKETNDLYGHEAGDAVLKHAAQLIKQALGAQAQGMAARLGGDEFVFYISPLPNAAIVDAVLEQLHASFAQVGIAYKNKLLYADMSAGVSIFPGDGHNIDQIVNRADKAMYENKRKRAQ
jgi:diguanylate cyclase (GGDEF)-like protein